MRTIRLLHRIAVDWTADTFGLTRACCATSSSVMAAPMPRVPPLTSTRLPWRAFAPT